MAKTYREIIGSLFPAESVSYDNSNSALAADNVQDAIDLVAADIASGIPSDLQVNDFASLPAPATVPNGFRYVLNETGSYLLFTKKKRGWYQSDGAVWKYAGDNSRNASDSFYDSTTSGLAANNVQAAIDEVDARVDVNDTKVSAAFSVTTHNDVTDAGSGEIITVAERALVASATQPGDNVSTLANDAGYVDAAGAAAAAPVQSVNTQTGAVILDTDDVAEAANLYYTEARVSANVDVAANTTHRGQTNNPHAVTASQVGIDDTDDVPEGVANLYYTNARVSANADVSANSAHRNTVGNPHSATTTDIPEGTNLYYTDARVIANSAVAANTAKVSADGSIDTHSDVDTTTVAPSLSDLLEWDGSNWVVLSQREEGVVKANSVVTALLVTDGTRQQITTATPLTFSSASRFPLAISNQFPGQTPTGNPATFTPFLYDSATDKWLENPKDLQFHIWRVNVDYTRASTNTNRFIIMELHNPLSGFTEELAFGMPNGAAFQTFRTQFVFLTIADSASIGFGYEFYITPEGDDITINDLTITRGSLAVL